MTADDLLRCELACTRLCNDFVWTVDNSRYADFVSLFVPEGVFVRAGQAFRGHAALRAFLDARPTGRITRHACSNIRIDMTGPDSATGTCCAIMFHAPAGDDPVAALTAALPVVVDYLDRFVRTDAGWRFIEREAVVVFQPAA
ncbi:MAG: nuclear transport factor 2 family protein [Polaromonas sp.]|nr:nuclear transport factor 2 family protein [Polaromonas sp.]